MKETESASDNEHVHDHVLLNETKQNLAALQSNLENILHFKSKWTHINTKLTSISSHLNNNNNNNNNNFPPHNSSTVWSAVLASISNTLSTSLPLSHTCTLPTPPASKLRTQSDIDSLSTSLHLHLHDLHILLSAPEPATATATGVSLRGLLTRVQVGTEASRAQALDELVALMNNDEKAVNAAVTLGVVQLLVRMLDESGTCEIREKLVTAIAKVSTEDSGRNVLVSEGFGLGLGLGLVSQLIRVLECGTGFARERACVVLRELSLVKENARGIGCRGGVSALLEICHGGTPSSQGLAVTVLRNLARFQEIKENFVEEDAVPVLVALSGSGTSLARENALGCLANLVSDDEMMKVVVVREGLVESLRNYWDSTPVGKELEPAVELLRNFASYHPIGEVLIAQGFHCRLLPLLNCGVLAVRVAAAGAVYELGSCSKARREMGECGCVSSLVRMIDGKAVEEKEAATKALSKLLLCHLNRKVFRKEERGIVGTVQLLDPLINKNLDKKWPVAVLTALVQSKKCRKPMIASGACVFLQKLVELDVDGAKKLLDSLGKGKIWGVFARP